MSEQCLFCGGEYDFKYKLNGFNIYKCNSCGTGTCFPKPDTAQLEDYYNGFMFSVDMNKYEKVKKSFSLLLNYLGVDKNRKFSFIDIGGSGGMFSKAYEDLGYGISSYIDIDEKSCEIARNNGVRNVIHGSIEDEGLSLGKYDIVFARHVIEHLLEPTAFIDRVYKMLNDDGMAILMFPNAKSYEYLADPKFVIKKFIKVMIENKFNPVVAIKSIGVNILHGLDPLRHLWSISDQGVAEYCKSKGYKNKIEMFRLDEKKASPFYEEGSKLKLMISSELSKINGGTHLMLVLEKEGTHSG